MRETDVIHKRLVGDKKLAAGYIGVARTLLGRMESYLGAGISGSKFWRLTDGTTIRTIVAGTLKIVEIAAGVVKCLPLNQVLRGFVCKPASDSFTSGYSDPGTPPIDHPDFPEVVVTPSKPEDVFNYSTKLYNKAHIPEGAPEDFAPGQYQKAVVDTCGKLEEWHADGLVYGNQDWIGADGIRLTWLGLSSRYFDGHYVVGQGGTMPGEVNSPFLIFSNYPTNLSFAQDGPAFNNSLWDGTKNLYYNGRTVRLEDGTPITTGNRCGGAGIIHSETKRYLVYVVSSVSIEFSAVIAEELWYAEILSDKEALVISAPVSMGTLTWATDYITDPNEIPLDEVGDDYLNSNKFYGYNLTPWLFNHSGNQAVCGRLVDSPSIVYNRYLIDFVATDEDVTHVLQSGVPIYSLTYGVAADITTAELEVGVADYLLGTDVLTVGNVTASFQRDASVPNSSTTDKEITISVDGVSIFSKQGLIVTNLTTITYTGAITSEGFFLDDLRNKRIGVAYTDGNGVTINPNTSEQTGDFLVTYEYLDTTNGGVLSSFSFVGFAASSAFTSSGVPAVSPIAHPYRSTVHFLNRVRGAQGLSEVYRLWKVAYGTHRAGSLLDGAVFTDFAFGWTHMSPAESNGFANLHKVRWQQLTDSDPVMETGLPGANPRFWPIGVI